MMTKYIGHSADNLIQDCSCTEEINAI